MHVMDTVTASMEHVSASMDGNTMIVPFLTAIVITVCSNIKLTIVYSENCNDPHGSCVQNQCVWYVLCNLLLSLT
jgi:hypothetical protein